MGRRRWRGPHGWREHTDHTDRTDSLGAHEVDDNDGSYSASTVGASGDDDELPTESEEEPSAEFSDGTTAASALYITVDGWETRLNPCCLLKRYSRIFQLFSC